MTGCAFFVVILCGGTDDIERGRQHLAAVTIRDERLRRAKVQRRRRKKRRSGNSFQEILQAAARKCIAA